MVFIVVVGLIGKLGNKINIIFERWRLGLDSRGSEGVFHFIDKSEVVHAAVIITL